MLRRYRQLVILLALSGCAADGVTRPVNDDVLADAKHRSQEYCAKASGGCEYAVTTSGNGWAVSVEPIYFSDAGKRVYPFHVDRLYYYDRNGQFIRMLDGN